MRHYKASFNTFLKKIVEDNLPEFSFEPEPDFQELTYPCVTVNFGDLKKSEHLYFWDCSVQIDILVKEFNRELCERATQKIFTALELDADLPGAKRRFPQYKFFDDDGIQLETPQNLNSDILYNIAEPIQTLSNSEYPELKHNTFTLELRFLNK